MTHRLIVRSTAMHESPDAIRLPSPRAMRKKVPCVYIMASRPYGTLYVGVTSNLMQRVWRHRTGYFEGFTKRYGVKLLVWYEIHGTMIEAITREKRLKEWQRTWKIKLVEGSNPDWRDLYSELH